MSEITNVLILCTGNSARSVLSEAILNKRGAGRYCAFSAGSAPTGVVNPFAVRLLEDKGYDTSSFRSKSWNEFAGADAPIMDIVITVCDSAAGETCPVWPGAPVTVHWGFSDPADIEGDDETVLQAFSEVYDAIVPFMEALVALDVENMDVATLKAVLNKTGKQG